MEILTDPISIRQLLNAAGSWEGTLINTYTGSDPDEPVDYATWKRMYHDSLAYNLSGSFRVRFDKHGNSILPAARGEKSCFHRNLVGEVVVGADGRASRKPLALYDENTSLYPTTGLCLRGVAPYFLETHTTLPDMPIGSLWHNIARIVDTANSGGYDVPALPHETKHLSATHWATGGGLAVGYRYLVRYDDLAGDTRYINDFVVRLTFLPHMKFFHVDPDVSFNVSDICAWTMKYEWYVHHLYWGRIGQPMSPYTCRNLQDYMETSWFQGCPAPSAEFPENRTFSTTRDMLSVLATRQSYQSVSDLIGLDQGHYTRQAPRGYLRFNDMVDKYLYGLLPMAVFSTSDAMEKSLQYCESNHIEAIAELGSVLDPLDLVKLAKTLPSYVGKKVVLLVKILDLITDAVLIYKLGIAPTLSDAEDVASKAQGIKHRLLSGQAFKAQTMNGKFLADTPAPFADAFPGSRLVVRSKVRTKPVLDSVLANLLTVDALGLLPKMSAFWDLVPMSFVLDKFFNVGLGLQIVEQQTKLLAMECVYCTHSFSLEYEFSDDDLSDFSLQALTPFCGYRTYIRTTASGMPVFGPTPFVTFSPGITDFSLYGSLFYKILKG